MQKQVKSFLSFLFLLSCASAAASSTSVTNSPCGNLLAAEDGNYAHTHWTERPAGQQYLIYAGFGVQDKINLYGKSEFYGVFDATFAYERTFRGGRNSSFFAGQDGTLKIGVGRGSKMVSGITSAAGAQVPGLYLFSATPPSAVALSSLVDIRASDLGLAATQYTGTFCFQPRIENFVANLDLWLGWDEFVCGLYSRIRVPINWTRWDIGLNQISQTATAQALFAGINAPMVAGGAGAAAFTPASATVITTLADGTVALQGLTAVGDMPVLAHGRICARDTKTGVADLPIDFIGYNFVLSERGRLGASLHVIAPTGTKNDSSTCIFGPRVGWGRWQVGAEVGAQYSFWNCDDRSATIYAVGYVGAVLPRTEDRLLGLRANNTYAFNHYLLLKKYNATLTTVTLERAANLLYQPIKLGTNVNSDVAVWFQYRSGGLDLSLGWQFTGRGKEKLSSSNNNNVVSSSGTVTPALIPVPNATFGDGSIYIIKGDTPEWVPTGLVGGAGSNYAGQAISITGYSKVDSNINTLGALLVPNAGATAQTNVTANAAAIAAFQAASFTAADVVADPALHPGAITNAVAGYIGYNMCEHDWQPFVGIGAMAEFGSKNVAMDMWNVFGKVGVAF